MGGVSAASLRSRGPWLASGLCCPAGSSLTMASSEPLAPPPAYGRASPGGYRGEQRVPTFSCLSVLPCRLPYPGGFGGYVP